VAVVIDWSKYLHAIVRLDAAGLRAVAQPGVVRDVLDRAAHDHGLTFGPDTATHQVATLGGMIGNNSCGVHSLMAGKTEENTEELEILTYDGLRTRVGPTSEGELERIVAEGGRRGDIYAKLRDIRDRYEGLIRERYPQIPRRVSGYNLQQLLPENGFHVARALVGTEGTCVTVLEATVRLVPRPPARSLVVLSYPSLVEAADDVPSVLELGPIGLEGVDEFLVDGLRGNGTLPQDVDLVPPGRAWLMVEFGGESKRDSDDRARRLMKSFGRRAGRPGMRLYDDPLIERKIWLARESALGATARVSGQPDMWGGWEDSAVSPERLGPYLRDLRNLLERYGYAFALYGHFGQGCVHARIGFDLVSAKGIATYRSFVEEAADMVVSFGGSLSGEHGDGQSRAELLPKMFGAELVQAFAEFKAIWDPQGMMNPGKVVRPNRLDRDLRYGSEYAPSRTGTTFAFPNDDGSFARAAGRCVGVGTCRRGEGGVMCPSYMVTAEEAHSTRGRANLLREMLRGGPLTGGWRSDEVKGALDLCLACKGCRKECPVGVDMATYKAEFLSHHYKGRVRPRAAYTMGLIYWWARIATKVPRAANFVARTPPLSTWLKQAGGVAEQRAVPTFATRTFRRWVASRPRTSHGARPVILWPDTFTNHFQPQAGRAALEVLETAGFDPVLPKATLCCGRPLYDYGMLKLAKRQLRQILDQLRPAIRAGIPVVGIEPSCIAVFRDELVNLFPDDEDARRLHVQSWMLSDFLVSEGWEPPQLPGLKAVVQAHCHHTSVMGFQGDRELLDRMGVDYRMLDSGCCGMAGSFGFEAEKYPVSMACGERVLLPAVRQAGDALIIADGFSCRMQIEQGTGRRPVHLAEVLEMAIKKAAEGPKHGTR
jgi:FAD/FMN-containing dehydrogenase/Fe-S oxidoreductase